MSATWNFSHRRCFVTKRRVPCLLCSLLMVLPGSHFDSFFRRSRSWSSGVVVVVESLVGPYLQVRVLLAGVVQVPCSRPRLRLPSTRPGDPCSLLWFALPLLCSTCDGHHAWFPWGHLIVSVACHFPALLVSMNRFVLLLHLIGMGRQFAVCVGVSVSACG
jgi:hypothetical protein